MLDFRDPRKVVVEGERGHHFDSMPTEKDLSSMNTYENLYNTVPMLAIIAIIQMGMIVSITWEEPILDNLLFIAIMVFLFLETMLLLLIVIKLNEWKENRNKAKGKKDPQIRIYNYVKVFPSVMFLHLYDICMGRTNVIMMKDVKSLHLDVPDFFEKKGIKLPLSYKPFRQKSPSPLKYPGSLYTLMVPMDHLVRIELKRSVRIKGPNPGSGSIKNMSRLMEDTIREADNLIISVRPVDQARFIKVMEGLIRK